MASKARRVFDWAKIAENLPTAIRAEMNAFRSRNESIKATLSAVPEKRQNIDWQHYKNNIAASGYVEKFMKGYEAVQVPFPKDTDTARIDAMQKQMESEIEGIVKESKQAALRLDSELSKIKAEKSYEETTIDEYLANHPQLRRQCEEDLKNFKYD
ncbi:ATP synthase subunit d, mitochondrial [Trichoplax sp. H2]|uniref:ATP synthase subunit d, mitochondrial n=1 Tax=Trichoplax adhaerens TaxID=10228 RepID=B3SCZ7_TRIAD|nr:expressed hypothetical protein [Trichoplax adhaerens]EDV19408.1 expressed hypothetical protein [Trichoplax adhaerens]RDD37912.1 ATP synthase subunit d, mitochondrial [Trichoplax sp. H2]|eukprot:XP_002118097.1 expressed hypothetical protein [Trichoplax adhaerens]